MNTERKTDDEASVATSTTTIGPTLPEAMAEARSGDSTQATSATTTTAQEPAGVTSSEGIQLGEPVAAPGSGEITRSGGPVGGIEYRSSSHPYKVFVGGISPQASEHDLFTFFERIIGTVAHVTLALDHLRPERYHKGYGFVVFASLDLRNKCLQTNRYSLMDRELEVKAVETGRTKMLGQGAMAAGMMPGMMMSSTGDVPDINKLFVAIKGGGGIGGLNEEELTAHFNHYGQVKKVVIVKDRSTGISKGYGFIYFTTPEAPLIAISAGREHCIGPARLRIEVKPFGVTAGAPGASPYMSGRPNMGVSSYYQNQYGLYGTMGYQPVASTASLYGGSSPYSGSPYGQVHAGGATQSATMSSTTPGMTGTHMHPRPTIQLSGAGPSAAMSGAMPGQIQQLSGQNYLTRMNGSPPHNFSYGSHNPQ